MKGEVKQPLKIGIHQDVLAYCQEHYPEQSRIRLRKAVAVYAKGTQYLACLKARHARVDLQGNPCDVVTEEQQAHAEEILKERLERVDKPKEQKSFFKKDALPPQE